MFRVPCRPPSSSSDLPGRRSRRAGFSIIELVIALSLVGLLVAVAVFRATPQLERSAVQRAANVLVSDLQYAQLQAVRQRTPIVLLIDGTLKGYLIRERNTPTVHRERFLGPTTEFRLDVLSADTGDLEFFPNGVAREGAVITLRRGDYERQVRLTRSGQVRIQNGP